MRARGSSAPRLVLRSPAPCVPSWAPEPLGPGALGAAGGLCVVLRAHAHLQNGVRASFLPCCPAALGSVQAGAVLWVPAGLGMLAAGEVGRSEGAA